MIDFSDSEEVLRKTSPEHSQNDSNMTNLGKPPVFNSDSEEEQEIEEGELCDTADGSESVIGYDPYDSDRENEEEDGNDELDVEEMYNQQLEDALDRMCVEEDDRDELGLTSDDYPQDDDNRKALLTAALMTDGIRLRDGYTPEEMDRATAEMLGMKLFFLARELLSNKKKEDFKDVNKIHTVQLAQALAEEGWIEFDGRVYRPKVDRRNEQLQKLSEQVVVGAFAKERRDARQEEEKDQIYKNPDNMMRAMIAFNFFVELIDKCRNSEGTKKVKYQLIINRYNSLAAGEADGDLKEKYNAALDIDNNVNLNTQTLKYLTGRSSLVKFASRSEFSGIKFLNSEKGMMFFLDDNVKPFTRAELEKVQKGPEQLNPNEREHGRRQNWKSNEPVEREREAFAPLNMEGAATSSKRKTCDTRNGDTEARTSLKDINFGSSSYGLGRPKRTDNRPVANTDRGRPETITHPHVDSEFEESASEPSDGEYSDDDEGVIESRRLKNEEKKQKREKQAKVREEAKREKENATHSRTQPVGAFASSEFGGFGAFGGKRAPSEKSEDESDPAISVSSDDVKRSDRRNPPPSSDYESDEVYKNTPSSSTAPLQKAKQATRVASPEKKKRPKGPLPLSVTGEPILAEAQKRPQMPHEAAPWQLKENKEKADAEAEMKRKKKEEKQRKREEEEREREREYARRFMERSIPKGADLNEKRMTDKQRIEMEEAERKRMMQDGDEIEQEKRRAKERMEAEENDRRLAEKMQREEDERSERIRLDKQDWNASSRTSPGSDHHSQYAEYADPVGQRNTHFGNRSGRVSRTPPSPPAVGNGIRYDHLPTNRPPPTVPQPMRPTPHFEQNNVIYQEPGPIPPHNYSNDRHRSFEPFNARPPPHPQTSSTSAYGGDGYGAPYPNRDFENMRAPPRQDPNTWQNQNGGQFKNMPSGSMYGTHQRPHMFAREEPRVGFGLGSTGCIRVDRSQPTMNSAQSSTSDFSQHSPDELWTLRCSIMAALAAARGEMQNSELLEVLKISCPEGLRQINWGLPGFINKNMKDRVEMRIVGCDNVQFFYSVR